MDSFPVSLFEVKFELGNGAVSIIEFMKVVEVIVEETGEFKFLDGCTDYILIRYGIDGLCKK